MFFSVTPTSSARIGPVVVPGRARRASIGAAEASGATALVNWVKWFETDAYPGDEALGGPFALPEPIIRFTLHPARPGEVEGRCRSRPAINGGWPASSR
ncbi:hypothetical protein P0F65_02000 [Sphingomonas sp. I4]